MLGACVRLVAVMELMFHFRLIFQAMRDLIEFDGLDRRLGEDGGACGTCVHRLLEA